MIENILITTMIIEALLLIGVFVKNRNLKKRIRKTETKFAEYISLVDTELDRWKTRSHNLSEELKKLKKS